MDTLKSVHDLGNPEELEDLPESMTSQIVSTRVRVGRTVKGKISFYKIKKTFIKTLNLFNNFQGFPMAGKLNREVILKSIIV